MKNPSREDWMREAFALAERGRFTTSPNPMVGAVVVEKGRVVGRGYHRRYGGDHAEVTALREAGGRARGAALYVTLEPCSTWGKTPPCVQAILRAGIRKVIVGSPDPNPLHQQKGIRQLRKEGLEVLSGVLASKVREQNAFFFKYMREKIPYVTLKMAQTWDGKIATRTGQSRWISSPKARHFVHRLRAEHDAVLVGTNTVLRDDPNLLPRGRFRTREGKPWRVVLDPRLEIPASANVFRGAPVTIRVFSEKFLGKLSGSKKIVIASPRGAKQSLPRRQAGLRLRSLSRAEIATASFAGLAMTARNLPPLNDGGSVSLGIGIPVPEDRHGRLDLADLLGKLGKMGIAKLLVEGGGEVAWTLLENRLVDRLLWIVAPKIFGGRKAKTSVEGEGVRRPSEAIRCRVRRSEPLGDDWLFEAEL